MKEKVNKRNSRITRKEYLKRFTMNPLDTSPKKYRFISLDTETHGRNNDFYLCGVLDYDDEYHVFYDKTEVINYLKRIKHNDVLVVATNLGFDYSVLAKDTKLVNKCDFITSNGRFIRVQLSGTYTKVNFIDTLNYGCLSVENMGKVIGNTKLSKPRFLGKKPKNEKEREELVKYNRQDCVVTKKYMELIQEGVNSLGGELKLTISSTSLDLFKRKYLKEDVLREDKNTGLALRDLIFRSYYGGRTEVFSRGWIGVTSDSPDGYFYGDVNSLYPSVMINDLPNPNSVKFFPDGDKSLLRFEGVSYFKLLIPRVKYPLLPYKLNGKLVFPVGEFTGYYTHVEMRRAVELYGEDIIQGMSQSIIYTEKKPYFKDYVLSMYESRKKHKAEGNPLELVEKLMMNSLYGKFAERNNNKTVFFDGESDEEVCRVLSDKNYGNRKYYVNDEGNSYYVEKEVYDGNHSFPIWSSYITSMARIRLHELILRYEPVYVDTDSVISKKRIINSKALGELKLEKTIREGVIIKPKMYFVDGDFKVKGVPTPKSNRLKNRLKHNILGGRMVRYEKFVKPKEAIRRKLVVNSKLLVSKSIDLEDNKRVWKSKFNPLVLEESEALEVFE